MNIVKLFMAMIVAFLFIFQSSLLYAKGLANGASSVELNGDTVEYSTDGKKITAKGNVVVIYGDVRLTCDRMEFMQETKDAFAEGHVHLTTSQGELRGEKMKFNFQSMTGEFNGAKIMSDPYYGAGENLAKVDEKKIEMEQGYITTCDHDKPHYRLKANKVEVFPGEKMIARGVRFLLGPVPILYVPKVSQNLKDRKPIVLFTPGHDKEWGAFVLSKWRYYVNENFKGFLHVDFRENRGIAGGGDLNYKIDNYGEGLVKLYYMNERKPSGNHFWEEVQKPIYYQERFKAEWRHKWQIDPETLAVAQYYKLSDATFLKDYFKRDYNQDSSPQTFFVLTKSLSTGVLSFRADKRVNRFDSGIERLPGVRYDLASQELGDSGLYLSNVTSYDNLALKFPSPTDVNKSTNRVDSDSQVSYPMKLAFLELKPFIGGRETYYSKTNDPTQYDVLRSQLKSGASLSTKFSRVYDVNGTFGSIELHRLRHIISPIILYNFDTKPTLSSDFLDRYDSVDSIDNRHNINLALENKLQTKRNNKVFDVARLLISTDFRLKEEAGTGGFDLIKSEIDIHPSDWVSFYFDSEYSSHNDKLETANFDLYLHSQDDKWSLSVGKRFDVEVDDQVTSEITYKLNQKWALRYYQRIDTLNGIVKEQDYVLTRDLHEWLMDIRLNQSRTEGSEILFTFTLKGFPDAAIEGGTSFNRRKAGTQNLGGE